MKREWNMFWNLVYLWRKRDLLRGCSYVARIPETLINTPLGDCTEEELEGIQTLANLSRLLEISPRKLKEDTKKIEELYCSVIKNT